MNQINEVKIEITKQGMVELHKITHIVAKSDDVLAFNIYCSGETMRLYPVATSTSPCFNESRVAEFIGCPSISICDGVDDGVTEICFPEYKGWRVHSVSGGKTMSVCLIKITVW